MKTNTLVCIVLCLCGTILSSFDLVSNSEEKFIEQSMEVIQIATDTLYDVMPPMFCWKTKDDATVLPRHCPKGYTHRDALCYENCRDGYEWTFGFCKMICLLNQISIGFFCIDKTSQKIDDDPYGVLDPFLRYYRPHSITKFNTKVECPENYFRSGLFCYRRCEDFGMTKCGCASCASSKKACKNEIVTMVLETIDGILKAAEIFLDGKAGIVKKIRKGINMAKDYIISNAFDTVIEVVKSKNWSTFKETAVVALKTNLKYASKTALKSFKSALESQNSPIDAAKLLIDGITTMIERDVEKKKIMSKSRLFNALNAMRLNHSPSNCNSGEKQYFSFGMCIKDILDKLESYDPTGLLIIATTFIHPLCRDKKYLKTK